MPRVRCKLRGVVFESCGATMLLSSHFLTPLYATPVTSDASQNTLTDEEIEEIVRRQQRSGRVMMVLLGVAMLLSLALPVLLGIAAYWLLSYYDVGYLMLRIWLSVGVALFALLLLHMVVMIPLTMFMATQSSRLHAAFEGTRADDIQAKKLIDAATTFSSEYASTVDASARETSHASTSADSNDPPV